MSRAADAAGLLGSKPSTRAEKGEERTDRQVLPAAFWLRCDRSLASRPHTQDPIQRLLVVWERGEAVSSVAFLLSVGLGDHRLGGCGERWGRLVGGNSPGALPRGTGCAGGASALIPVGGPSGSACHVGSAEKGKGGRVPSEGRGRGGRKPAQRMLPSLCSMNIFPPSSPSAAIGSGRLGSPTITSGRLMFKKEC